MSRVFCLVACFLSREGCHFCAGSCCITAGKFLVKHFWLLSQRILIIPSLLIINLSNRTKVTAYSADIPLNMGAWGRIMVILVKVEASK